MQERKHLDPNVLREMLNEWAIAPECQLSDGESYATAEAARTVASAYKRFIDESGSCTVATGTGATSVQSNPEHFDGPEDGFVFALSISGVDLTTPLTSELERINVSLTPSSADDSKLAESERLALERERLMKSVRILETAGIVYGD